MWLSLMNMLDDVIRTFIFGWLTFLPFRFQVLFMVHR
jgi:hypothetical protein